MVRRRGNYQVRILGKPLICLFCEKEEFQHREVYIDLQPLGGGTVTKQLTFQSFNCISCGDIRMFEEKERFDSTLQKHVSSIEYMEVTR